MRAVSMIIRSIRVGLGLPVVLSLTLSAPPAMADNTGTLIGNVLGTMIVMSAQEAERKRQEQEIQEQLHAQQQLEAQQKHAMYVRAQTALKELGFYNMDIDGAWGPGSKSAMAAYQTAFDLPHVELSEYQLSTLEQIAAQGWRSADEYQLARDGGFYNRDELVAAQSGGFQTRSQWKTATSAGFDNRQDFLSFTRSGFSDANAYRNAMAGGFADASEYTDAIQLGFDNVSDYRQFVAGDYANKSEFDQTKAARVQAEQAKSTCIDASTDVDTIERDSACRLALDAFPNNPTVVAYAQSAKSALDTERASLPTLISEKQRTLSGLLANPDELSQDELDTEVTTIRAELEYLGMRQSLIALQEQQAACSLAVNAQDWEHAKFACAEALAEAKAADDIDATADVIDNLRSLADVANEQATLVAERAAREQTRLALASAKEKGNSLVAEITGFSAEGNEFRQGLRVARALVTLNQALKTESAEAIENTFDDLLELVEVEAEFLAYREDKKVAAEKVEVSAAIAARRDAENLNSFLQDYISHNLTVPSIGDLLDLQAQLETTLQKGNTVEIASALSTGREAVFQFGLNNELEDFVSALEAPIVSEQALVEEQAEREAQTIEVQSARSQAAELVDEVGAYSQSDARFADPLAVGRALVALRGALSDGEVSDIVQSMDAMEAVLAQDAAFQAAREERAVATAESRQNARVLAEERAKSYGAFLVDHIASNITSPDIGAIIDLQDKLDSAASLGDWQQIMVANSAVEDYLASNDLDADYRQFAAQQSAKEQEGPQVATAQNGIALNAANEELLSGHAADILVLKNNSGAAPSMAVNLLGNLTFDNDTATACWLNEPPTTSTATLLMRNELRRIGATRLNGSAECSSDYMQTADLILVQRGAFLERSATDARPAILDFEKGRLVTLVSITNQHVAEFEAQLEQSTHKLTDQIAAEEKEGFGLIYLPGGNGDICFASDADALANANLLSAQRGVLQFYYTEGTPTLSPVMLDRAFVLAQRGECSGIYTDTGSLKVLLSSLERESVPHLLVPLWITGDAYQTEVAQINETKQQREARLQAQRQRAEAEAELQRQKNATAERLRLAEQEKMRAENNDDAMGATKEIGDMASAYLRGNASRFGSLFPEAARLRSSQAANKWKVTNDSSSLWDYGTGLWQNRRVSAVLVEVRYQSENAVLGQYREDCAVVGYLIDEEFSLLRDAIEAPCAQVSVIRDWQHAHMFESGWFAE